MKKIFKVLEVLGIMLLLVSCGNKNFSKMKFNDGTYIGKSEGGEPISYVDVTLEIKDNKIVDSKAEFKDSKKNIKDENYGKEAGEKKYAMAQKSVKGMNQYAQILLEVQDPEKIDSISGATISYKLYKEAVWNALDSAKK